MQVSNKIFSSTSFLDKAIAYLSQYVTERKICLMKNVLQHRTKHLTVVLEDLYQSHNISAALRSCECFGIQDVYIIENINSFKLNPDIALGATKWLNLHQYNSKDYNTIDCIKNLKKQGYSIVSTVLTKNERKLDELQWEKKMAFLFGSEENGLSQEAIEGSDYSIKIPMYGFTQSFNISVSVALVLQISMNLLYSSKVDWQLTPVEKKQIYLNWLTSTVSNGEKILQHFQKNHV